MCIYLLNDGDRTSQPLHLYCYSYFHWQQALINGNLYLIFMKCNWSIFVVIVWLNFAIDINFLSNWLLYQMNAIPFIISTLPYYYIGIWVFEFADENFLNTLIFQKSTDNMSNSYDSIKQQSINIKQKGKKKFNKCAYLLYKS